MEAEEIEAIAELKAMPREDLDKVKYTLVKWCCQGKGCSNGTKVRDYGISPEYYLQRGGGDWVNLNNVYWMCGRHYKAYKRFIKSFDHDTVERKLFDFISPLRKIVTINAKRV